MHPRGPDESRLGTAGHRPPSARSRDALAEELRREVAEARLRLEEAGLRAETHRLLGNHQAAVDATREQEDILADVETRLGRVVSSAVVQRDAEQVLADATGLPVDLPAPPHDPREIRPRTPMLAGVASVLAVVAVSTAAVLGVTGALDRVQVVGAASDLESQQPSSPSPGDSATRPALSPAEAPRVTVTESGTTTDDGAADAAPTDAVAAPDPGQTATSTPAPGQTNAANESDDGDTELDQAVTELLDAVGGLDQDPEEASEPDPSESDSETPGAGADMSGEDLGELVDEGAPDVTESTGDGSGDGFVPAPSAQ